MTETVHSAFRITAIPVADGKIDAGRSQRQHRLPRLNHADTDSARRVIAAPGHHRYGRHIPAFSNGWQQRACHLTAFVQRGHMFPGQMAGIQHRLAPVALRHVEPHGAGGIGHVAGEIARYAKTQIVFRQQDFRHLTENLRFVALHPQQFGRSKAGHHQVAGNLAGGRHARLKKRALFRTAAIVPEDRWTQHAMLAVEQRSAVHLSGNSQRFHVTKAVLLT